MMGERFVVFFVGRMALLSRCIFPHPGVEEDDLSLFTCSGLSIAAAAAKSESSCIVATKIGTRSDDGRYPLSQTRGGDDG